jgi:hypothetical protein
VEGCHQLIIHNDRVGLARRSVDDSATRTVRNMRCHDWAYAYVCSLHDRFFAAWNGQAFKIKKGAA